MYISAHMHTYSPVFGRSLSYRVLTLDWTNDQQECFTSYDWEN